MALALPGSALAATPSSVEMRDAMRYADTEFNEERERCRLLKGDAGERCMAEARARHERFRTQAEQAYRESDRRLEAANRDSRAQHRAARQECDALQGSAKRACLDEAKVAREQERVQLFEEAGQDRMEANYRAELARCDSPTERDAAGCRDRVDVKYGKSAK